MVESATEGVRGSRWRGEAEGLVFEKLLDCAKTATEYAFCRSFVHHGVLESLTELGVDCSW
jgi:hypothetical protein